MSSLLRADIYRMRKNRLTFVSLILVLGVPVLITLMYLGIQALFSLDADIGEAMDGSVQLFSANSLISSAYSLTNNIGLVIPAFAGILVCTDYSNGTLRNKVIAGNKRTAIYFSHLVTSILFSVVMITIYAAVTTILALIFFKFNKEGLEPLAREIIYFVVNGTLSFVFMATVSTMLAMVLRSIAPTLIFTIVLAIVLMTANSIIGFLNYEKYKYVVYFIPTFCSNFFNLQGLSLINIFSGTAAESKDLMFAEGMASYLFFGAVNTMIGLLVFNRRDIK